MRILILGSKEYPLGTSDDPIKSGGIEKDVQGLAKHLSERFGVVVVTRRFRGTRPHERENGIEVFRVPWIRGRLFRAASFNLFAFLKALFIRDYDAVLSYALFSTLFGRVLSCVRRKKHIAIPTGITHVQPQFSGFERKILELLEKTVYRTPDMTVFLSEQNRAEFVRSLGFLPKRHRIIPHAVEYRRPERGEVKGFRKRFGLGNGTVITFIGRFVKVKGADVLVSALEGMKGIKALFVGDGPERESLMRMVREKGLDDRIVFTGWMKDVSVALAATDVFVLPSYSEGLPLSLLEAMAAGKPCVVTDIGLPVENGKDSLVVKPGDAGGLKEAIRKLVKDRGLRERLGKEARKKVSRSFSWERCVREYERLLRSV